MKTKAKYLRAATMIMLVAALALTHSCEEAGTDDGTAVTVEISGIALSEGTLTPTFDPATTAYSATVPNATSSITVTVTTENSNVEVTIDGDTVIPGDGVKEISLTVGENPVEIVVTDGTDSVTYTVTVTRLAAAPAVELSGLSLSEGTLAPAFDPATTSYTATVPNETSAVTVTVTTDNSDFDVAIDSVAVLPGTGSKDVNLSVGENLVEIVVTDGAYSETYTVTITREAPEPADIQVVGKASYSDTSTTDLASGSLVDFENVLWEEAKTLTFTINNTGGSTLTLTATAPNYVVLTNNPDSVYTIVTQPNEATIPVGGSREFVVEFDDTNSQNGTMTGTLEIANDDPDEGGFTLDLTGESGSGF